MDVQSIERKRPAAILSRDNWQSWFQLLEIHLKSKKVFYTLRVLKTEYAWIVNPKGPKDPKAPEASTPDDSSIEGLTTAFERLEGT